MDITSRDPRFREEILLGLRKLGFNPTMNGKNIQIYRKKEIDRFFNFIKPQNARHLKRYHLYKKTGKLKSIRDMRS